MKKLKELKEIEWTWLVVVLGAGYLACTTGREAVHVWELWFLVAAFTLIVVYGFIEMIRGGEK